MAIGLGKAGAWSMVCLRGKPPCPLLTQCTHVWQCLSAPGLTLFIKVQHLGVPTAQTVTLRCRKGAGGFGIHPIPVLRASACGSQARSPGDTARRMGAGAAAVSFVFKFGPGHRVAGPPLSIPRPLSGGSSTQLPPPRAVRTRPVGAGRPPPWLAVTVVSAGGETEALGVAAPGPPPKRQSWDLAQAVRPAPGPLP